MEVASREGLYPAAFWKLTPREFARFLKGRDRADRRALALATTQAWQAANFAKAKKLPELNPILRKIVGEKRRPQTPAESLRIAEQLNARFGGKDLRRKEKG